MITAATLVIGVTACRNDAGNPVTQSTNPTVTTPTSQTKPPTTQPPPSTTSTVDPRSIYPTSAEQAASYFNSKPNEWARVGSNGWVYGSKTSGALRFTVPANCLVDTVTGRHGPGTPINSTALTIYWIG